MCKRRSVRLCCHESPHGEAIGSLMRLFHTVSEGGFSETQEAHEGLGDPYHDTSHCSGGIWAVLLTAGPKLGPAISLRTGPTSPGGAPLSLWPMQPAFSPAAAKA